MRYFGIDSNVQSVRRVDDADDDIVAARCDADECDGPPSATPAPMRRLSLRLSGAAAVCDVDSTADGAGAANDDECAPTRIESA
jgi:hypothetical protein